MDRNKVNEDAIDAMWAFLRLGGQKANIQALRENCETMRRMMEQKTAGQRAEKPRDIPFEEIDGVKNGIVIEALALYLSGALDKLEREM